MRLLYTLRMILSFLVFLAIGTIVTRLSQSRPDFSYLNFFSYFTNQSNLLVAFFFLAEALMRAKEKPMSRYLFDRTRGALTLYMTMTTSIYWLFLHRLLHFTDPAVIVANIFQHSGCIIFLIVDTLWDRPQSRLCKRNFLVWLIFPFVYAVGIMIQGMVRGWYPYPFLNIEKLGTQNWILWNVSIAINISLIGIAIVLFNNKLFASNSSQNSESV